MPCLPTFYSSPSPWTHLLSQRKSFSMLLALLHVCGLLLHESQGFFLFHGVRRSAIQRFSVPSARSILKATSGSPENSSNKPPTLNGKVIFPTKTLLQGLQGQPMKVAAVYAILNHQYKRGSGDGWEYCEYIGITKDLQFVLDTYTKRLSVESVAYVKALSFSYPQKSVMEEIATSWRALAKQHNGPVSINTALDAWIVVPESGVASQVPDSSSNPSTVPEGKDQRTQQIVEFIRATQYNDDDEDDEEDEEDEANQVQEVVSNIMNNAQTQGSNIVSPFMNDSLGTAQVLTEEKTIKQPLIFNAVNVEKVLDEVRPYLISDGGNVSVQKVDTDKNDIYLLLEGACGSCSSSTVTMQLGIERTLRENFPDLGQVIQVAQEMSNADSKADYLTTEAVNTELNRISPAVTAMGAVCEIISVDPIGVVELRFRGSTKVRNAVELALLDVPYVKHIKFT